MEYVYIIIIIYIDYTVLICLHNHDDFASAKLPWHPIYLLAALILKL